jgi:amidase
MSVFSVDPKAGGPVTTEALRDVCKVFGVKLNDDEEEDYRKLLAVFDESAQELMSMPDYVPEVDLARFPRKDIRQVSTEENTHGAWAWRCSIKDTQPNNGLWPARRLL